MIGYLRVPLKNLRPFEGNDQGETLSSQTFLSAPEYNLVLVNSHENLSKWMRGNEGEKGLEERSITILYITWRNTSP